MTPRLNSETVAPDAIQAMFGLESYVRNPDKLHHIHGATGTEARLH